MTPYQEIRARALLASATLYASRDWGLGPGLCNVYHTAEAFERYITGELKPKTMPTDFNDRTCDDHRV